MRRRTTGTVSPVRPRPAVGGTRVLCALVLASSTAISGCAADAPGSRASLLDPAADLTCWEQPVARAALDDGPPVTDLATDVRAVLDEGGEATAEDPDAWVVLEDSPQRVSVLRPLPAVEDFGGGDVRTHELRVAERAGEDSDAWFLSTASTCALRTDLGDLGPVTVTLDPEHPPTPDAHELRLLVTETACNSGQDAEGRVRLVGLVPDDGTIELVVAVEPREGEANCPSNPPTPFVVPLDEALGERTVLDGAVQPPREVTMP